MNVLGIETSCDETAAAVVVDGRRVLSNVIASQDDLHEEYGGVVPEIASRAHVERILPVVRRAVSDAGLSLGDIEAIAVGHRPGLIGSLVVGVAAAKALAWGLGVPIIGVDHVEAHLAAGLLEETEDAPFPAVGLVVSGGHTSLYSCASITDLRRIGSTIDDAVGEAYDKVATMLGLGFPGGARVDALAQRGDDRSHAFPVSLLGRDSLEFSFSGLKTAVLYAIRGVPQRKGEPTGFARDHAALGEGEKADIAASFQRAAVEAVTVKVRRAIERMEDEGARARSLLVGGGVSANSRLRGELAELARERGMEIRLPRMEHCMDNAAMIAGLGWWKWRAGQTDDLTLAAAPTAAR